MNAVKGCLADQDEEFLKRNTLWHMAHGILNA
jgi:hypothetical protein